MHLFFLFYSLIVYSLFSTIMETKEKGRKRGEREKEGAKYMKGKK